MIADCVSVTPRPRGRFYQFSKQSHLRASADRGKNRPGPRHQPAVDPLEPEGSRRARNLLAVHRELPVRRAALPEGRIRRASGAWRITPMRTPSRWSPPSARPSALPKPHCRTFLRREGPNDTGLDRSRDGHQGRRTAGLVQQAGEPEAAKEKQRARLGRLRDRTQAELERSAPRVGQSSAPEATEAAPQGPSSEGEPVGHGLRPAPTLEVPC